MTVTSVRKDTEALSMTLEAEFDVPAKRVWQLWEDPRQLEQWWGPPTYPATVTTSQADCKAIDSSLPDLARGEDAR